jgi:hypothetical protein
MKLEERSVDELRIEDEASFGHVALYADLKAVLRRAAYRFRLLPRTPALRWDRALFLNLTFWGATGDGDVLVDDTLPADVVAHAAWHHLAARALALAPGAAPPAEALFFGEAIASAFDVYLVGRLLGHSPESSFLETQVAAMADAAEAAGQSAADFDALLDGIAQDPERAFADLRELLYDATSALVTCACAGDALAVLGRFDGHRFASLLHHYELSNWVLYARAYARPDGPTEARVATLDRTLRDEKDAVDWLTRSWVLPAVG